MTLDFRIAWANAGGPSYISIRLVHDVSPQEEVSYDIISFKYLTIKHKKKHEQMNLECRVHGWKQKKEREGESLL